MRCQYPGCNKPATVHLTEIKNGVKKEVHLCEEHAAKMGLPGKAHFSLTDLLAGVAKSSQDKPHKEDEVMCENCGLSLSRFQSTGRFGCAKCYVTFKDDILPLVEKIHESSQHVGKVPGRISEQVKLEKEIRRMRNELEDVVRREDYERAAELRDQIRSLEEKMGATT
jgi:protein arginine kinase activator